MLPITTPTTIYPSVRLMIEVEGFKQYNRTKVHQLVDFQINIFRPRRSQDDVPTSYLAHICKWLYLPPLEPGCTFTDLRLPLCPSNLTELHQVTSSPSTFSSSQTQSHSHSHKNSYMAEEADVAVASSSNLSKIEIKEISSSAMHTYLPTQITRPGSERGKYKLMLSCYSFEFLI